MSKHGAFMRSLGFLEYGIEKNALKQNGHYYDEIFMAKDLLEKPS